MPFWPWYSEDVTDTSRLTHQGAVYPSLWEGVAPYLVEFLGTFLLTVTFICNYTQASDPIWATTSNAFMVMAIIYAFGHVSGANFNPSVCLALWLSGRYQLKVAVSLTLVQILGAISAGLLYAFFGKGGVSVNLGPHDEYGWYQVIIVEVLYTGMICFVYLNCGASMKNNPQGDWNGFLGLAVGFCFVAGGYAARDITNTVFNSAISIGLTIVDNSNGILSGFSWVGIGYFIADLFGAFVGSAVFHIARPKELQRSPTMAEDIPSSSTTSAKVFAEFLGTFWVVLTKALNRVGNHRNVGSEAWSVAAALTAMVYSLRDVSGGHFNPIVTLSVWASQRGEVTGRLALLYLFAQVVGGAMASGAFAMVKGSSEIPFSFEGKYSWAAKGASELLFSFLACYVVLSTSTAPLAARSTKQNNIAGFAYGACHTVGGFAVGNISGSILNPAVALAFTGLNVFSNSAKAQWLTYIGFEVIGSLLAAGAFVVTHPYLYREDWADTRERLRKEPGGKC